jgi:hypothetical protein
MVQNTSGAQTRMTLMSSEKCVKMGQSGANGAQRGEHSLSFPYGLTPHG